MYNRVVITGMGVVSPNAIGLSDFEQALRQGRSGIRFIPRLDDLKFGCRIGGVPDDFDSKCGEYFQNCRQQSFMSETIRYAVVSAADAWQDAGFSMPADEDPPDWDTGTVFGCGISDMEVIASEVVPTVNAGKVRRLGTRVVERVMGSATSARLAGVLALGNQVTSNSSACSTGPKPWPKPPGRSGSAGPREWLQAEPRVHRLIPGAVLIQCVYWRANSTKILRRDRDP